MVFFRLNRETLNGVRLSRAGQIKNPISLMWVVRLFIHSLMTHMNEIGFLTCPALVNLIPFNLILFSLKNTIPIYWTKITIHCTKNYCSMTWLDQWWARLNEIYCSILLISFNFVYIVKSYLFWWSINKSCSKTKEQTHEIQLNFCKIQVLMRTKKILWYKWNKPV